MKNLTISIWITVWARFEDRIKYLRTCLESLNKNLFTGDLEVQYLIGCETENAPYQALMVGLASEFRCKIVENLAPANLGANLNSLHQADSSEFVLYVQDDFILTTPLKLEGLVQHLMWDRSVDMIRLAHRRQDQSKWVPYNEEMAELAPTNPEFYSDNPHLRRRDWFEKLGSYDTADNRICEKSMDKRARKLARILIYKTSVFDHIGIYSSMVEKWETHPKGWASNLWLSPEEIKFVTPENPCGPELSFCVTKILRDYLPTKAFFAHADRSWLIYQKYKDHLGFPESTLLWIYSGNPPRGPFPRERVCRRSSEVALSEMDLIVLDLDVFELSNCIDVQRASPKAIWVIAGPLWLIKQVLLFVQSVLPPEFWEKDEIKLLGNERGITVVVPNLRKMENMVIPKPVVEQGKNLYGASIARLQAAYPPDFKVSWDALPARMLRQENFLKKRGLLEKLPRKRVLDIGPGIPFFPILIEELGHDIVCVETPEATAELQFQMAAGLVVKPYHIMDGKFQPSGVTGQFELINLTGIQFDLVNGQRWEAVLWVEFIKDLLKFAAKGATIYVARNWEILEDGTKLVRHYSSPVFLDFLGNCSQISKYEIRNEILEIQVVG